jgi:hypothetical protein
MTRSLLAHPPERHGRTARLRPSSNAYYEKAVQSRRRLSNGITLSRTSGLAGPRSTFSTSRGLASVAVIAIRPADAMIGVIVIGVIAIMIVIAIIIHLNERAPVRTGHRTTD